MNINRLAFYFTTDCNLHCVYCYNKDYPPETAKLEDMIKAIDYTFKTREGDKIIFVYSGGDILNKFDILKDSIEYIISRCKEENINIKDNLEFSFHSNGVGLANPVIFDYFNELQEKVSLSKFSVSFDGKAQDIQRCGTFDIVSKIVPWIYKNGGYTTATYTDIGLPYIYDSLVYFIEELHIPFMMRLDNVIDFTKEDEDIYRDQLIKCYYYLVKNNINILHTSSLFFDTNFNFPVNYCGLGNGVVLGMDGKYYPCSRAVTYHKYCLGSAGEKPDFSVTKHFRNYSHITKRCLQCKIAGRCTICLMQWEVDTGRPDMRSTKLCNMMNIWYQISKMYTEKAYNM